MTDPELLETVASVLGKTKTLIRKQVGLYKKNGMLYIYGKTMFFWIREQETISLTSGDYLIDVRDKFDDFMRVRFMWTSNGLLESVPEDRFRRNFPDDTGTGEPNKYMFVSPHVFQLHPRSSGSFTLNCSYYYKPRFDSIRDMPEEWHHVIMNYILMMFDVDKYGSIFYDSLRSLVDNAKPSVEEDFEFLPEDLQAEIPNQQDTLKR
jgi:hypothetical protein